MSNELRILILEDRPADAELVTRELRKAGFEFVAKTVTTEREFLAELRDSAPELILADYTLPGYDGLSALAAAQKQCPETPFIFVSGSMGEEKAIETLHCGATDYVLKQRLARLGPAVRRALREREERRKREQAEEEGRESEKQLRAMFDLASVGMAQADPRTGQWLRVNQKMCAITGYSAAEMLRMRVPELTHPDDREKDGEMFARVVRGEASDYRLEKRYVRKDGAVAWVNVNMTVIRDAAGQPVRTVATIEDITERKRAAEELRENERRYRLLFNSGYDAVFVHEGGGAVNGPGKFIEVNDIACQRLGYTREELLQMTPQDISAPETLPDIPGIRAKLAAEKSAVSEGVHITKNGRRIPVEISTHVFELNGKPTRLSTVRDITERKRAELRITAFAGLGQRLNTAKTAKEAGEIIVGVADKLLGWDACLFDLYSAAENSVSRLFSMDLINGRRTECEHRPFHWPPTERAKRAIEQGGQLILRDHPEAMRPEGVPFGDASRASASILFVPIRHGPEIVGFLSIQSYTPNAYDTDSLEALQALADYAGGALERLRAQEALNESEATFRSVWERSVDGMRLTDQEGRIIAVNEAFCQLVRLPREKLEGQVFSVAYKGHGPTDGIELYQKRFATGEVVPRLTTRTQLCNGEEVDLEISSSFIELGQRGKMLLSIFRDVSERKWAEAELKRSHEQYRHAIAAANAIPYQKVFGADTYAFMGEGIKELTGYAPDELRSSVWREIILETVFLGEAAGLPLAEAARRTRTGEIKHWRADHRIRTRNGGIRWISDSSIQLFDADGKFSGSIGIIQDITQRKELEVQLRQAQKMEAVGQLAGGVAHDFNNMLAVIRGNAELLLMDEDQHTAETREGLKHVVEASERAANLTRQLLTFSRRQVMQSQPVVLNEVIANLTKMLHRVISENIDLQCQYAVPLAYVQADTGMMEQVILNLVVNARDAMPGGGHLRLATEQFTLDAAHARSNPEARAGEFACLVVSDTGTGIAPEVLPRIFDPFFTTKDIGKGTGLGLATVYGIVQQHQGWIEVSSQVGEGSTFKVFLPAIPTPAGLAAAAEVGADIRAGKETILLVEDEHSVRMATRRVLESKGYTVREATSAREALELWQVHAGEIALLLTDIVMPGEMTGRDLAERLWGERPGLKVIFMSGYSAEVLGKGTDFIRRTKSRFLQKPSSSRAILETVRRCLDEKESVATPGQGK